MIDTNKFDTEYDVLKKELEKLHSKFIDECISKVNDFCNKFDKDITSDIERVKIEKDRMYGDFVEDVLGVSSENMWDLITSNYHYE